MGTLHCQSEIFIFNHEFRESSLESGKPMVDAAFGETLVTLEKLAWLINHGEKYLKPEYRESGAVVR